MQYVDIFIPPREERQYLNRFYVSSFLSEATNIVLPFQFIFLFLVMDKPEWAVIPLIVEGLVVFLFEIPTGIIADRYGRKASVIIGDTLSGVAWLAVPLALVLDGPWQLIAVCIAFALEGIGQTLVSGAEEAWVVDNLIANKKENLSDQYFAREKSLSSLGGVLSGSVTWLVLTLATPTAEIISALWIISGIGQIASALILLPTREHKIAASKAEDVEDADSLDLYQKLKSGEAGRAVRAIIQNRALLALTVVTLIVSFATAVTGDAFEITLLTDGMNPKELAPLAIATDLLGFGTPLVAVMLSRYMGPFNFLSALLVVAMAAILLLFASPPLVALVVLFLFFNLIDDLWDPIADAVLHSYIASPIRATVISIINQFSELVGLAALMVFAFMLGEYSERIETAIPDLVEAFRGVEAEAVQMPTSLFGLPVQDAALVLFTAIGLLAVPILLLYPWKKEAREIKLPDAGPAGSGGSTASLNGSGQATEVSSVSPRIEKRFLDVKKGLDELLERYNPGEFLSWNVSDRPFDLPQNTMNELKEMGPALQHFFVVANDLFYSHNWIQNRIEKRISPHYAMLNRCQPDALPRLIRPDVVCDSRWMPRLVELETTVGARADTAIMARQYGLNHRRGLIDAYANMAKGFEAEGKNLALVTAPHPFFQDLPDDAKAFASMLAENGVRNVIVLSEDNLMSLRFDGTHLWLTERFKAPTIIHVIDRFIDIYEIAELQHPGMAAILDAYLAGAITDVNTVKQCLDEKDWMSLFWEEELAQYWERGLGEDDFRKLQRWIPRTWTISENLNVLLDNGVRVPVREIGQVRKELRTFVIKESGTSTTSSGAQAFYPLLPMDSEDIEQLIDRIIGNGTPYVIQELIESPRMSYGTINPDTDEVRFHANARFKLSPFYLDGVLSDIRFVASDQKYAVNDDEDCVVSVVRYS